MSTHALILPSCHSLRHPFILQPLTHLFFHSPLIYFSSPPYSMHTFSTPYNPSIIPITSSHSTIHPSNHRDLVIHPFSSVHATTDPLTLYAAFSPVPVNPHTPTVAPISHPHTPYAYINPFVFHPYCSVVTHPRLRAGWGSASRS
jgi:hypothetical protein